jgi:hypothetical protein
LRLVSAFPVISWGYSSAAKEPCGVLALVMLASVVSLPMFAIIDLTMESDQVINLRKQA